MTTGLLSGKSETWGTFPAKTQENEKEPRKIQDFAHGTKIEILGAIGYNGNFGKSIMLYAKVAGGSPEKLYLTKTAVEKLAPVIDKMPFPYQAVVVKGKSDKFKTEFTSLGEPSEL